MNGNGRLIQPNAMNVETTYAQGPLAQPSSVVIQTAAGMKVLVLGGLTKIEALAGQIAGQVSAGMSTYYMDPKDPDAKPEAIFDDVQIVAKSVDLAEAILDECERRRPQPQQESTE